ncbi:beta-lactamase family protein [Hymenobacter taeanensis]|uniref:Beta-lactamase family protein n=1 Tax=Hymenobacter taeanensis TaxID=2735321 RepID=A0A6M6BKA8_9BACT|nr:MULTISPECIES: serine hydrolase domain-containing protein [Hymenobacter]QJX49051.1 beta-lactamase family protein [Hymenobacter taeanensis]UOQ81430.1 beta-lactamase family protein [Hymenobacter sp. 5414T-23]
MKKLFLLLAVLSFAAPCFAQLQRPKSTFRPVITLQQLTDSIERIMHQEHIPGLMLTLVSPDSSQRFVGGLGLAEIEHKKPVTANTLFRIGSVTKTFVAVGLMQLVEQGKLNLNDEVRKLAPEIPLDNPWEATDPVRVVHLLEHTAGFDDMHFNHVYNTTATDPQGTAVVEVFRQELRCRWRPGERMSYSNPGYEVAGYLLEKLSGQPYQQYLAQHLLRPLGMPDATATLRPGTNPQLAQGYDYENNHYQPVKPWPIYAGPAGSMSASARDMARWVQFFLHGFRAADGTALLQPASLREIETPHSPLDARAGLPTGYALANSIVNWKGKASFRGHGGGIGGFTSAFAYNRALGLGYAMSNNGGQSLSAIEKLVREFLLGSASVATIPAPAALDVEAVAPYLGHYQNAAPRNQLLGIVDYLTGDKQLVQAGQMLLLRPLFGSPDTLLPAGALTFRRPNQVLPSAVLTHTRDGQRMLVFAGSYYQEASSGWWWLRPALLGLSVLLMLTSAVAGLIWLIYAVRRQLPRAQVLPRLLPLFATIALVTSIVALVTVATQIENVGRVNTPTVLLSLAPLAFVVCTLAGLLLTMRTFRHFRSRAVAWYLLLTYGALGWLAATLASFGWMSLQLWSV